MSKGKPAETEQTTKQPAAVAANPKGTLSRKSKVGASGLAGLGLVESEGQGTPGTNYVLLCKKKIWANVENGLESDFVTNIMYFQVRRSSQYNKITNK